MKNEDQIAEPIQQITCIVEDVIKSHEISADEKFHLVGFMLMNCLHILNSSTSRDEFSDFLGECLESIGVHDWVQPKRSVH